MKLEFILRSPIDVQSVRDKDCGTCVFAFYSTSRGIAKCSLDIADIEYVNIRQCQSYVYLRDFKKL